MVYHKTLGQKMKLTIRKTVSFIETTFVEGHKEAEEPLAMVAAAAVVKNPWAGRFEPNLTPVVRDYAPQLGELLTAQVCDLAGGVDHIEAFGKAAVVGLDGEIEHASALIHTLHFGNIYREAVQAKSFLSFTNTRGPANAPICVPMMDKNDGGRRSHYLTLQFAISDAPCADEIVVVLGAATGGRPHHRIGDRYLELQELGHDDDNPAAV